MLTPEEFLSSGHVPAVNTGVLVTKQGYHQRLAYATFLSHSTREVFHACKRKFELAKIMAHAKQSEADIFLEDKIQENINFAFGHSLGAGIQHYILTRDLDKSIFESFLAWNVDFGLEDIKSKKSWGYVVLALQQFKQVFSQFFPHHEVATLYGRPAIELTFSIDLKNGYKYFGNIDAVLRDLSTDELFVLEVKTTGRKYVDAAMYQNSEQPLGYTCVLDKIAHNLKEYASFNVVYFVYLTSAEKYEILPFPKSRAHRAEFLQSLLMDCDEITRSRKMNFFPKNGSACFSFSRSCQFFGLCNLSNNRFGHGKITHIDQIPKTEEEIDPAFRFSIDDLIEVQLSDL